MEHGGLEWVVCLCGESPQVFVVLFHNLCLTFIGLGVLHYRITNKTRDTIRKATNNLAELELTLVSLITA